MRRVSLFWLPKLIVIDQGDRHAELRKLLELVDGPICRMSNQLENIEDHLSGQYHAMLYEDNPNGSRLQAREYSPLAVGPTL